MDCVKSDVLLSLTVTLEKSGILFSSICYSFVIISELSYVNFIAASDMSDKLLDIALANSNSSFPGNLSGS